MSSQTKRTQTFAKTLFVTWLLYVYPHCITEPVISFGSMISVPTWTLISNSTWNVWMFSFPQWADTQVHGLDPIGEALGKSLCITGPFSLRSNYLINECQIWKLKNISGSETGQETFGVTSFNLPLIHSCSVWIMYIKQCILAAQQFLPSRHGVLLTPITVDTVAL